MLTSGDGWTVNIITQRAGYHGIPMALAVAKTEEVYKQTPTQAVMRSSTLHWSVIVSPTRGPVSHPSNVIVPDGTREIDAFDRSAPNLSVPPRIWPIRPERRYIRPQICVVSGWGPQFVEFYRFATRQDAQEAGVKRPSGLF